MSSPVNQDTPPGFWASAICRLDWPAARRGHDLASALLRHLSRLPPVREPSFQPNLPPIAILIRSTLRRSEAARMQISGDLAVIPCTFCAPGNGIYGQCVAITGCEGLGHCANCHAAGAEQDCHVIFPIKALGGSPHAYDP